jgi:hypothetical protein
MIVGIIYASIGAVLEILYWTVLKDLIWIEVLIYPPPEIYSFIKVIPIMGWLFVLVGVSWLILSLWLYLKADLEYLRKINQFIN